MARDHVSRFELDQRRWLKLPPLQISRKVCVGNWKDLQRISWLLELFRHITPSR